MGCAGVNIGCISLTYGSPSMQPYIKLPKRSLYFNICCKEIPLQLIDLKCLEVLKFVACHFLNFYDNHILPSGWFSKFITHTQQMVSLFGTTYYCEQLFSKVKHNKSTLYWQLSNHQLSDVLLLSSSLFYPDITCFLWVQTILDVSLINYDWYLVNLAVVF